MANKNTLINYVEFKSTNLKKTKEFYSQAFGWVFTDYGDAYTAFSKSGLEGGFELTKEPIANGALVVLHHDNLNKSRNNFCGWYYFFGYFLFPRWKSFSFYRSFWQ